MSGKGLGSASRCVEVSGAGIVASVGSSCWELSFLDALSVASSIDAVGLRLCVEVDFAYRSIAVMNDTAC